MQHSDKGTANYSKRHNPKLLHQREVVFEMPVLGDQTVLYAVDVHRYEINSLALPGGAAESGGKVSAEMQEGGYDVARDAHLLDLTSQIRNCRAKGLRCHERAV